MHASTFPPTRRKEEGMSFLDVEKENKGGFVEFKKR
jgi:hypothetical protein